MNMDYTLWPNTDGNLGNIKVQIPDGVTTQWPDGDALVNNFIYKDGKLSGFVDTKALIENDSKTTVFPYDYVDITLDKRLESLMTFNAGERCKHLNINYEVMLPAGYTRVEYISPTQSGQSIQTDIYDILPYTVVMDVSYPDNGVFMGWRTTYLNESGAVSKFNDQSMLIVGSGENRNIENTGVRFCAVVTTQAFLADRHLHSFEPATARYSIDGVAQKNLIMSTRKYEPDYVIPVAFMARNVCYADGSNPTVGGTGVGSKHYNWQILEGDKVRHNWIPALDPTGAPCMYDIISQEPFYNEGTGQFFYPGAESQVVTSDMDEIFYAKKTAHGIQKLYHVPENFSGSKDEYAIENGFKQLVEPPMPTDGHWSPQWIETDTQLICNWVETDV